MSEHITTYAAVIPYIGKRVRVTVRLFGRDDSSTICGELLRTCDWGCLSCAGNEFPWKVIEKISLIEKDDRPLTKPHAKKDPGTAGPVEHHDP